MFSTLVRLGMVLGALLLARPATAALMDYGAAGEYFYDTSTGLYWYDPVQFVGQTRDQMDAFVTASPNWNWATSGQIEALNGQEAVGGGDLELVLGARQYSLVGGGPRWLGYYASTVQPDGWIVQAETSGVISDTGSQYNAADSDDITGVGAWMVSTLPPAASVPEPHVLTLVAAGAVAAFSRRRRQRH